ncbi:MAG: protein kinase domain-containing protein [Persicimonas sp.]
MVESAESFGKYTLIEKVAAGGMAEIFRAKTVGIGGFEKLLAIKRLHPQFSEENEVTQMLVDEARIAVHLTHPNIAQIFDLGCIDGQYFIAMEFIEGVDLHQINKMVRERGSSLPIPALVFILAEALGGLHYAHTRTGPDGRPLNIVHRDVSPQNIMVSYEGEVKLVDFGIAKAEMRAQQDTQHGIIKGKFYYMAPEQAHAHHVDQRTDIFAAGMVLYELLAGRNPYARIEEFELLKAVRLADFPAISSIRRDIDPELERIIDQATRRDANYRFQSAREMRDALMDYLDKSSDGPYRRTELAKFVRGLGHRQGYEGMLPEDSARMSRQDYEASDSSMIFEPGSLITEDDTLGEPGGGAGNPFAADEPTQLWSRDEGEGAAPGASQLPSGFSSPQSVDATGFAADNAGFGGAVPPEPEPKTSQIELPLFERIVPGGVEHPRAMLAGVGMLVVVLGGFLAYLIFAGGGAAVTADSPSQTPRDEAPGAAPLELQEQKAERVEQVEPAGGSASEADNAVLKISTYPPDAEISVDGESVGRSPVGVGGLSREHVHTVVANFVDGRELSQDVRWADSDERVKEVELTFERDTSAQEGGQADKPGEQKQAREARIARPTKKAARAPRGRAPKPPPKLEIFNDSPDDEGTKDDGAKDDGRLDVRISSQAKVYIDGRLVADGTERYQQSLADGTYDVKVYFVRIKRFSEPKKVQIRAGETSRAHFAP